MASTRDYGTVLPRRLAFIGLGVMGYPMAGHLARAGHRVTVYNRTPAKAEAWVREHGGRNAPTPREAAAGADVVFSCVGNDDDLRSVVLGDAGAAGGTNGANGASLATTAYTNLISALQSILAADAPAPSKE